MATFRIEPPARLESQRAEWVAREELAEHLIPLIGRLYRDYGVVTSIHGHRLINLSATGVISVHDRARDLGHEALTLDQSRTVLEALLQLQPAPASIDVARLAMSLAGDPDVDPSSLGANGNRESHATRQRSRNEPMSCCTGSAASVASSPAS